MKAFENKEREEAKVMVRNRSKESRGILRTFGSYSRQNLRYLVGEVSEGKAGNAAGDWRCCAAIYWDGEYMRVSFIRVLGEVEDFFWRC